MGKNLAGATHPKDRERGVAKPRSDSATLARYEGGSLQDKAYDQLLRACDRPDVMADTVRREGDALSPRQRRDVEAALHRFGVMTPAGATRA